jgi:rhodanese-related sulfurtransferase
MSKQSKESSSPTTQHTDQPHVQHASRHQPKKRKLQRRWRNNRVWFAVGGGLVAIVAIVGLLVFFSPRSSLPNGSAISPQELKQAVDAQANMTIVDVRSMEEYKADHIKNSILLPLDALASKAAEALPDKNQTLYVYCRTGLRSAQAVSILQQQGYVHVHSLNGGITAWQNSGYPVVNS